MDTKSNQSEKLDNDSKNAPIYLLSSLKTEVSSIYNFSQ